MVSVIRGWARHFIPEFVLFSQGVSLHDLSNCDSKIFLEGSDETNKQTKNKKVGQQIAQQERLLPPSPVTCLIPGTHMNKGGTDSCKLSDFHFHTSHV